ncbi:hypothetical protein DVR12_04205 [Chitinophaga silvatica]|uniref:Uncharacterized protein n=1 Tax=Chitinophaga silvatica TaxID=2282649 RepID=A0A3E1YI35_9BACT|nr:hypothetical protein [Chitinophaga silvatica]RFS26994.1 hypothetical protein DVR12_04205 [Chitinophaga silvatica]
MQTYTYSQTTKVIFCIIVVLLAALSFGAIGYGLYEFIYSRHSPMLFISLIGLGLLAITTGALNDTFATLTIDEFTIKFQSRLYTRELALTSIKGYIINPKNNSVKLYSVVKGQKGISVSPYLKNRSILHEYIFETFTDLTEDENTNEYESVVEKLGDNGPSKIKAAKRTMYVCNAIIISLALLTTYFKQSYSWLHILLFLTLIPLFGVMYYFRGIYTIDEKKDSELPGVFIPVIATTAGLFFATLYVHVLTYKPVFIISGIIALILFVIFVALTREKAVGTKYFRGYYLVYAIMFFGIAYGFTLSINKYLDKEDATVFQTQVTNKRKSKGSRSSSYYVELAPWGPHTRQNEESVPLAFYDSVSKNQPIKVYLHKGFLGIGWYEFENE